jgi:hypothetical protein
MRMQSKARILATALAISLSTPAAAATITLSPGFSTYQIIGPSALSEGFLPGVTSLTFTPELPHVVQPGGQQGTYWEYWVDVMEVSPFGLGYIIASECFIQSGAFCIPERAGPPAPDLFHVGDVLRLGYFFTSGGAFAGLRPTLQLDLRFPDGVTLSQTPLPAAWLMFASALAGVGGWLGLRRRAQA